MSQHEARRPEPMFLVDIEGAPKIVLGGREWAVPQLAIKQSRHVVPALMEILPLVTQLAGAVMPGADGRPQVIDQAVLFRAMGTISEQTYEAASRAIFWALKRAHPGLAQAEFDDMPITMPELFAALPVVMRQTGFIKSKPAGDAALGEEEAVGTSIGI